VAGERLTSSDKRALALWVLAGVIGALCAYKFYFRAFPEASVNFQVSREAARKQAETFVTGMGSDVRGYQSAIVFSLDEDAKTYLEREVGLRQANQLMGSELNIWYWEVRFFKPQQEEEFRVRVSPAGQIVGYEHHVAENFPGASLGREEALAEATQFASTKLGVQFSDWDLLADEVSSVERPNRLDWSFTWEKRGFRAKDAPYRMDVVLEGSSIGDSKEFLKIPEAWNRSFAHLRAQNNFISLLAILPYLLLLGSALWLGIALTRRGSARWGGAIKIGVLVALLLFSMQLNAWPEARAGYDTNSSYATFIVKQLVIALLFGIGSAIFVTLVLPAGDALYRVTQPARLRLGQAFSLRGLRSKEFFCSSVVGLSLTAASLGFVVVFYMVGSRFGVWAPQEINYENSVSTLFPWITGVAIGLLASTNEEFTFRLFAIPFIERLTGSRWLAVIIPAFCWSFLHANYPQEPPYIRGLEVGMMGLATGVVFLRWGIVATLIWHYTFDASQVGLLLIRSHSWYFRISGLVVGLAAVAPLLFSAISYLQRGGFEVAGDLLNSAEAAPEVSLRSPASESVSAAQPRRYTALTPAMLGVLALLTVGGALAAWRVKSPEIGDYLRLAVDARGARARGDEILQGRKVDVSSYRHVVAFLNNSDPLVNEFLRERLGVRGVNDVYSSRVPVAFWKIRYFRDGQKEEYAVVLTPDGALHAVWHVLPEDARGAQLAKDAAVALGEKYLQGEKHLDLARWKLVDAESEKRPQRVDHILVWEENEALTSAGTNAAEEAHTRVRVQVLGDEVVDYQIFIKIPDEWSRQQQAQTVPRLAFAYGLPAVLFGALGITILVIFLRNLKSAAVAAIPWKRLVWWSSWSLLAFYVAFAFSSRIPDFLMEQYHTDQPLKFAYGILGIGALLGGPFRLASLGLLFGVAWFYAHRAFGEERIPGWLGMPTAYYRDALFIALGGTGAFVALRRVLEAALVYWPTIHRVAAASWGENFGGISPAAAILAGALGEGLFYAALAAVLAAFVADCARPAWLRALLFLGGALALVGSDWGSAADYAKHLCAELILLAVIVLGVRYVARFNLLGYFLLAAAGTILAGAVEMLKQDNRFYQRNGFVALVVLALLLAWPLFAWLFPRPAPRGLAC
jgi:membrane protease YdiL (CAAX protease family)